MQNVTVLHLAKMQHLDYMTWEADMVMWYSPRDVEPDRGNTTCKPLGLWNRSCSSANIYQQPKNSPLPVQLNAGAELPISSKWVKCQISFTIVTCSSHCAQLHVLESQLQFCQYVSAKAYLNSQTPK